MSPRAVVRSGAAAVVLAATLGLAGCGGSNDDDPYAVPDRFQAYCDEVKAQQATIGEALATGGDATGLIKALPAFRSLAAKAPADLADDWGLVVERIQDLVDAIDAAGLDPETYDRKHPPKDLAKGDRDAIDAAAVALVSTASADAMTSVQQQARDVCKTPLYL